MSGSTAETTGHSSSTANTKPNMSLVTSTATHGIVHNHHHHHDDPDHHVHFDEKSIKDDFQEDNSIIYQKSGDNLINIHLGFLQINHRYVIELQFVKATFFDEVNDIDLVADTNHIPNVNCKIIEYQGIDKDGHVCLKIEFFAHKEKLLRETLAIKNLKTDASMSLMFHARVLGRGKGTPMLRNGIHSIGIEADEESEASDWHNFDSVDAK
jgi:hypothetical protein